MSEDLRRRPVDYLRNKPEDEDGKKIVQVSTTLIDNELAIGAMTVTLDLALR